MEKKSKLEYIKLEDLKLDINNPRFAELYKGSTKEEDLILYLLNEEAAEEIAKAIVKKNEFYEDKALWVIKDIDGKYSVRDGNRRCAAVKALQLPGRYLLAENKMPIEELPVYIYEDEVELKSRIAEEHAASLFRSWERIAKALHILDLANSGKSEEISSLDSKPGDFIKLGSFYKEAVIHGDEEFRKQIRRGRGKTGGKTIIYERLFRDAKLCGYKFKNSPSFKIEITDEKKFKSYIIALVKYIKDNPDIKTSDVDNDRNFIKKLKDYGFDSDPKPLVLQPSSNDNSETPSTGTQTSENPSETNTGTSQSPNNSSETPNAEPLSDTNIPNSNDNSTPDLNSGNSAPASSSPNKRGTVKKYPDIKRKQLPSGLKARIDEYFDIDSNKMPNSKIAMARVTYECVMKYVVENTKHSNILLSNSGHFGTAYKKRPHTDFDELNKKFIELILNVGFKKAFTNFDFEKMHQIIHNYHVSGTSHIAEQIKNNLIVLIEFMLQDITDLVNSLDISKIK
ncbi:hypothetical protein [Flavobacterium soyae]|uniref:ParB/Sulfiredoxin domain-containing protein n=1 Tax=Flavobacterium soyae TaxID=2903098 RepID=A0ABZ2UDP6_9FLAO